MLLHPPYKYRPLGPDMLCKKLTDRAFAEGEFAIQGAIYLQINSNATGQKLWPNVPYDKAALSVANVESLLPFLCVINNNKNKHTTS